jgi:hypothetical protein
MAAHRLTSLRVPWLRVFLAGLALVSCRAAPERVATARAQAWLSTMDAGNYAQGWAAAAPYLQRAAPKEQWEVSMNRVRAPLGRVLSRTTRSATATRTAYNDPCVIVELDTAFEHKPSAVETVTLMPAPDGEWKVAGYYIK